MFAHIFRIENTLVVNFFDSIGSYLGDRTIYYCTFENSSQGENNLQKEWDSILDFDYDELFDVLENYYNCCKNEKKQIFGIWRKP